MTSVVSEFRSAIALGQNPLRVEVGSGDVLDVQQFSVHQRMSALFQVSLIAVSHNANIDFDAVVGKEASFLILTDPLSGMQEPRCWRGVCNQFQQMDVGLEGASTFQINIVPSLWFATQRRNHRMFQQISEPDIVLQMLGEWGIEPEVRYTKEAYKKRRYRVQYGESDFAFMSRMLEDAGIAYFFEQQGAETKLVLSDAPQRGPARPAPLPFKDRPTGRGEPEDYATAVRVVQQVRPGKYTLRDHDYRLAPSYKLMASSSGGTEVEEQLERFHYTPGAFLFRTEKGESTPVADDRGKTRSDEAEAAIVADKRLYAKRGDAKVCSFETNVLDLAPGVVMSIDRHPRHDVGKPLLIVDTQASGTSTGQWTCRCEARPTNVPYRPPLVTPKPQTKGVESATVVGPEGEEIHTDEFGRVRVHFHWDRESQMNEQSSCWIHVNQPWGGTGYGGMNLPRIGQEVLVDFLGGDPDRPMIIGRVYTNLQKVPYKLPASKTQSGWKSNSTNHTGGYNEIMFEDTDGKEQLRMQAERDMSLLVKHDATTTVRGKRTTTVIGPDLETVTNVQRVTVTGDRSVTVVDGKDEHTVRKDIVSTSQEGNTMFTSAEGFVSFAGHTKFVCTDSFEIFCGASSVVIRDDRIVLQSPNVYINPGGEAVQAAIKGTPMPPTESEKEEQRAKAEKEEAARQRAALVQTVEDNPWILLPLILP